MECDAIRYGVLPRSFVVCDVGRYGVVDCCLGRHGVLRYAIVGHDVVRYGVVPWGTCDAIW